MAHKRSNLIGAVALGAAAVLGVGATSLGLLNGSSTDATREQKAPLDTSGYINIEPGSTDSERRQQINEALDQLAGHQSNAEIDALSNLPYTTFLADLSGNYVAAVNTSATRVDE